MRKFEPIKPEQDPAGKLAEMVVNTRYSDIPAAVIDVAKKAIFDTLAVTIAGSKWEVSPQIAELVKGWGGKPESTVLIYGYKVPAPMAAFVNGVMARAIDMGDVHETAGHITECIVPTLCAAAGIRKKKTTGRDFLIAYIVGAEVNARIGSAIAITSHSGLGIPGELHHSICATAAVSRLLGLSVDETWNAMGITYSVTAMQELQKYAEGTQMARVQHCFESQVGVLAPLLAQRNVTGPKGIFLGVPAGIFRHLEYDDFDPGYLTDGLGKKWLFAGLSLKPYSSCKYGHSYIDAMIELVKKHKINHKDIKKIHLTGSEGSRMTVEPKDAKWHPTKVGEACYSAPYAVATAAVAGKVFLDDFSEEGLKNPEKRRLMDNTTVSIDPGIKTQFDGFTVEVTLKNGKKYSQTSRYVLGHPKNPMSWDDVTEKFWRCVPYSAKRIAKKKLQHVVDLCTSLEKVKDIDELIESLAP